MEWTRILVHISLVGFPCLLSMTMVGAQQVKSWSEKTDYSSP